MNKKIFFLFFTILFFNNCAKETRPTEKGILLRFQPKIGSRYRVSLSSQRKTVQIVMGRELVNQKKLTYDFTIEVNALKSNQNRILNLKIERIQYVEKDPDRPYFFDSELKNQSIPLEMQAFSLLCGKIIQIEVRPDGTIEKLLNEEALLNKMLTDFSNNTKVQLSVRKRYNQITLSELIESILPYFSKEKIFVGDSWQRRTEHFGDFPIVLNQIYTLRSLQNNTAIITQNTLIQPWTAKESVARQAPTAINYTLKYLLKGQESQTLLIDKKSGWILELKGKQHLSGEVRPIQENRLQEIPKNLIWPITIDTDFEIKSKKE